MLRVFAVCVVWAAAIPVLAAKSDEQSIREAVIRGVVLIQKSHAAFNVPCISCHHQGLGVLALEAARRRGIAVDEQAARDHVRKTFGELRGYEAVIESVRGIDPMTHGYGLIAAHAFGLDSNLTTAVLAKRFLNAQLPDGHWDSMDARPPLSESAFAATALGVRVLNLYLPQAYEGERANSLARARNWFLNNRPHSTEDASYRLLGLAWSNADPAECRSAAAGLLATQHADGGWSQVQEIASDAYATGEALFALRTAGGVANSDQPFRRGVMFLLQNRRPDGSWLVKSRLHSRAQINPPFFDAGFPNGRDQFISFAGTCWAVMALAEALPEAPAPVHPSSVAELQPQDVQPWMDVALFGNARQLEKLLKGGLDPNSASPGGVTLLMMAAPDREKMMLLLERGARVNAESKSGATALVIAASYRGTLPVLRMLVERGADVTRENSNPEMAPLLGAVAAGDTETASFLMGRHSVPAKLTAILLDAAVMGDKADMVRLLVQKLGANVNQVNGEGMTPLVYAALMHHTSMVRTLLELGANREVEDKFGQTALQHTGDIWYSDPETAEALKRVSGPEGSNARRD